MKFSSLFALATVSALRIQKGTTESDAETDAIQELIDMFDKDGNGKISKKELYGYYRPMLQSYCDENDVDKKTCDAYWKEGKK